jgi:hypothetical protein
MGNPGHNVQGHIIPVTASFTFVSKKIARNGKFHKRLIKVLRADTTFLKSQSFSASSVLSAILEHVLTAQIMASTLLLKRGHAQTGHQ